MSVRTMARVWESSQHAGTDLLMLLAIADFSDDDGLAFPAVEKLAKKCRMSKRNAQDRLRELSDSGELTILKNQGPPPKYPNLFKINLDELGMKRTAPVQPTSPVQYSVKRGAAHCMAGVKPTAPKPSVNHQEPSLIRDAKKSPRLGDSVPAFFPEFWNAYDKKTGKVNAIKEWRKIKPDADLAQSIIAAATAYAASREQKFRKDPERWLKGGMWQDEDQAGQMAAQGGKPDWMAGAL